MEGEEGSEETEKEKKKGKLKWDSQSNLREFSLLRYNQFVFICPKTCNIRHHRVAVIIKTS
jgi:hypothetical protein